MNLFKFQKQYSYSLSDSSLTLISLEKWAFVYVRGIDSKKHLQNQLTIDINLLQKNHHKLCAHCNIDGKVWATMLLFHYKDGYAYITRRSIVKKQVLELKKYAIFFDIEIKELSNIFLLGLFGTDARFFLLKYFLDALDKNSSILSMNVGNILCFSKPYERFLLILDLKDFLSFRNQIDEKVVLTDSNQWSLLDIEAGFPIIDKEVSQKFLPQSLNLDQLQAISLEKGCYYGQEIIAKVFYKNLNKNSLYTLIGQSDIFPRVGQTIEAQVGEQWYRVGFLLAAVSIKSKKFLIQVVLKKTINIENIFRIHGVKSIFLIKS
ncbi:tRNA-modifying protein YgfZ [Buchnera aphidicola (Melanaphis sacchari)]|uniref:tRNA-modifying protein YgfZ n=1 Tax=Buchnera aphidicola (Melanaphis sacchari) TaxID=2173854 RepID=A0A2U8DEU9_9GAMM|nr:tRNA-modifying protein YgfZ [Buchnera aphidicola]AWH90366.1 tRNA-modifying protein YgfZ [Buchnera aphidicola (Melanaphis sacchari)]